MPFAERLAAGRHRVPAGRVCPGIATAAPLGPPFTGAGAYPVGRRAYGPTGGYRSYTAGLAATGGTCQRYVSPVAAAPVGAVTRTRFDRQAGVAAGTFAFPAEAWTAPGPAPMLITQGQCNVTF